MSRKMLVVLVVLSLAVVITGCRSSKTASGASTGAGGYVQGSYSKTYNDTVPNTYNAALSMLQDEKIPVYSKQAGSTVASIEGTLSDGKKLTMDFKSTAPNTTQVTVHVGTFGDSARTNYLFGKLDERLMPRGASMGAAGTTSGATGSATTNNVYNGQ